MRCMDWMLNEIVKCSTSSASLPDRVLNVGGDFSMHSSLVLTISIFLLALLFWCSILLPSFVYRFISWMVAVRPFGDKRKR